MRNPVYRLIDRLYETNTLSSGEFYELFTNRDEETDTYAKQLACRVREENFGNSIYIRGLIEFTNYCKNDCYYCGIRRSNKEAQRYRLDKEDILACCEMGYGLGFRTFVLQGGEDAYFTETRMTDIIRAVKEKYPDCALTLSIGEKPMHTYEAYRLAGADRYLLRHETADDEHYGRLHPPELSAAYRRECLQNLKNLGFQTGAGFMVGSPYQTTETLVKDFLFLKELNPEMVGIGPFISHHETPFKNEKSGTLSDTLFYLGILRLMLPRALLPATTALGTIHQRGRELGILAGANVVMPNLSPAAVRRKYLLYDDKICTGEEAAEGLASLRKRMESIGCHIVTDRGDYRAARS